MGQTASQGLTELCRRMKEWRRVEGGGRGRRIPEELWAEAARVARVDGLYATARTARFNYERLKQRVGCAAPRAEAVEDAVAAAPASARERSAVARRDGVKRSDSACADELGDGASVSGRFVAVEMAASRAGSQTTIELVGRAGERMRVEVGGEVDLVGVVQAFWRQSA